MKELLKQPYAAVFGFLLLTVPLIHITNTNELYEFPKMFYVYFFSALILFVFLTESIWKNLGIKRPALPILFFLLANILSVLFSDYLYTSVWGYYTRFSGGLSSLLLFAGLYVIVINRLDPMKLSKLLKVSLLTIVPIALYGMYQYFFSSVDRIYSTFGQPNWLAQYLVMLLPLCLLLAWEEDRWLGGTLFFLGFASLWLTFSLSGILGLLVGMIAFFLIMRKSITKKKILGTFILFLLCFLFIVANPGLFLPKVQDAFLDLKRVSKYVPALITIKAYAASESSHKVSDPGYIRGEIWKSVLPLVMSRPQTFLIGTGPETFPYSYQPFRSPSLNYSSEWDFVLNKPHNYYLQLLVEVGILGLVAYSWLILWMLKRLPKILLPTLLTFCVTNLFGWPVVATSLIFWILVAFAHTYEKETFE